MRKIIWMLALTCLVGTAVAQEKGNYELAERFTPAKIKKMVHSTVVRPNWLKGESLFWYSYKTSEGMKWYMVNPSVRSKKELFDHAAMAREITRQTGNPYDAKHLTLDEIRFNDNSTEFTFEVPNKYYVENKKDTAKTIKDSEKGDAFFFSHNLETGKTTRLSDFDRVKKAPEWASVSPDGETIIFARNFNLFYMDRANFEKALLDEKDSTIVETQITTDGVEGFEYGEGNGRKNNVDIEKEKDDRKESYIAWSPDSNHFALIRYETLNTPKLWVVDPLANPRPTLEAYPYLLPGEENSPQDRLFIFDNKTKEGREVNIATFKDQSVYIHTEETPKKNLNDTIIPLIWTGDNTTLYATRTSRDIKRISVIGVDVNSLEVNEIVRDSMNVSIESRAIRVINSGEEVIIWSERDGWGHFYLYSKDGKLINQITTGEMHTDEIVGVNEEERLLYFIAQGGEEDENPYYTHLYKVRLDGTGLKNLNKGDFDHTANMNDNNSFFVNNFSRVDTAPATALYNSSGRRVMALENADLSLLLEAGYKFPETFIVKAADGVTDLHGVMYKPFDFDPTRIYPVISYVYPGPQTESFNTYFSRSMTRVDQLAQMGFIVVTVGNRGGSPQRSKWYHTYGYGNMRDYGLADQRRAIETLAARHTFIDIDNVGIHGHSGGGFMSTAALLTYPDFFKVAVSCAGNHDNNIYNNWWSEKHHGVREVINESDTTFDYNIGTNQDLAKNLKGKLLLVHGAVDDNVHVANTYRMVDALIKANKRFDLIILPNENHSFRTTDSYFFWRMADYFTQHLMGESRRDETSISQLTE